MKPSSIYRKIALASATLTLAAVAATGCATTRTSGEQLDDSLTTARVGSRLSSDPDVPRHDIDVDTLNGVVTLRGQVPSSTVRYEAVELARETPGVAEVVDQLEVIPEAERAPKPDGDGRITARVHHRLAMDPDVIAADIDIDTRDGIVTLSGIVENPEARAEAERLARETEGVLAVRSELQVGPRKPTMASR